LQGLMMRDEKGAYSRNKSASWWSHMYIA